MLAIVQFPYNTKDKVNGLVKEDWNLLREHIPTLRLSEWDDEKGKPSREWWSYCEDVVIDMSSDAALLSTFGIKFEVQRIKNSYHRNGPAISPGTNSVTYNFALPNIGLLAIDEVTWLNDACTEELQRHLDDKWRIIAVCPPNGARRPDYILGRTKTT